MKTPLFFAVFGAKFCKIQVLNRCISVRYLSRTIDIYIYMHIVFDKFLADTQ